MTSTTSHHHHHRHSHGGGSGGVVYSPLHAKGPGTSNTKGDTKWRNCFHITPTKPDGTYWLTVRLNNKRLGVDRALVQDASAALEQFLRDHKKEYKKSNPGPTTNDPSFVYRYRLCANVELAENQLTSPGCIVMLNTLAQHKVQCKALRLYRNCIDDVAVCRLSQMLADQNEAIEELHLSNNRITERGIMQLLMTFALHPNHAYPWQAKSQFYQPTWLRMENNNISKPQEMLDVLTETGKLILCIADDKSGCGPSKCVHAFKEQKPSPIAHLHMYDVHPNAAPQGLLSKEDMVKIASCKSYDEIKKLPPPKSGPVMSISGHTLPPAASSALSAFIGGNAAALATGAASSQTHSATQTGKRCPSGGGINTAVSGPSSGAVKGAWPAASRPSGPASDTVIHRYQLVNLLPPNDCSEEAADLSHCICGRCNNVLKDPIQARPCRHRFCRNCFQAHMERFTIPAKQKNQPVTSIPCPSCDHGLARSDVGGLDDKTLREYRQTRVRCKHHPVNFVSPLYLAEKAAAEGALGSGESSTTTAAAEGGDNNKKGSSSSTASGNPPSELVKTALGIECRWQGTVSEYAAHIHQCQVEEIVRDQMAPRADFASVVRNKSATNNAGGSTPAAGAAQQQQQKASAGRIVSPTASRGGDKMPVSPSNGQRGQQQPLAASVINPDVTSDSTTAATGRTEPPPGIGLGPLPTSSLGMIEAAASIAAAVEGELKNSAPKVYEAMAMGANDGMMESGTLPPTSDWSPNSKASRKSKPPMTPLSRLGDGDDVERQAAYIDQMQGGLPLRQEDHGVYGGSGGQIHGRPHGKGYFYDQRVEQAAMLPRQQQHQQQPPPYHQMGPADYLAGPPPPSQQQSYSNQTPYSGYDQPPFDNSGYNEFNGVGGGGGPSHFMPSGYEDEASRRRREFEAIAAAATAAHQYPGREYDSQPQYHHHTEQQQQQQTEADTRAVNEYRRIVHDFVPDPQTMNVGSPGSFLDLCAGDVVRVLEVTASGWAAGMRVDEDWRDIPHPQTGSTAWFPYSFSVAIER